MTTETREASGLDAETLDQVRDLILVLADSKRLLGYRYAEWMLGAPELETGIACSSMAQDEWGHARLLYALLKSFGEDVEALEHGREADAYRNMAVLDEVPGGWPETVALMVLADGALTVQFEALRESSYEPLRQRVEKLLDEEGFHAAHGTAWFRRLAGGTDASRVALREAVESMLPRVLEWLGPEGGRAERLREAGVLEHGAAGMRERFLDRMAPLLELIGADRPADPTFDGFDEARRRSGGGGPDEETIRKIRGDRNRIFLLDG